MTIEGDARPQVPFLFARARGWVERMHTVYLITCTDYLSRNDMQRTTLYQMEEQMKQRVKHEEESRLYSLHSLHSLHEREMRLRSREQQM